DTLTFATPQGSWYGAGPAGAGTEGVAPITVNVNGPGGTISTTNTLGVPPASYAYGTPGTFTPVPPLPLHGSVTLPAIATPGLYTVSITEGAGPTASTNFWVPGDGTVTGGTVPTGSVGPHTNVLISGSTGWAPDTTSTWIGQWIPPTGCNGNVP